MGGWDWRQECQLRDSCESVRRVWAMESGVAAFGILISVNISCRGVRSGDHQKVGSKELGGRCRSQGREEARMTWGVVIGEQFVARGKSLILFGTWWVWDSGCGCLKGGWVFRSYILGTLHCRSCLNGRQPPLQKKELDFGIQKFLSWEDLKQNDKSNTLKGNT